MGALRHLTPPAIRPPFARYSHGVLVEAGARLLFCSGQLGVPPAGEAPADAEGQARQCFANIAAVLAEAGMAPADVVRVSAFVTAREHMPAYMRARDAFFDGVDPPPASTLMVVAGFSRPELLVEVEVVAAARPGGEA